MSLRHEEQKCVSSSEGTTSNLKPTLQGEWKKQDLDSKAKSSFKNSVGTDSPVPVQELNLKVKNLEQALKRQLALNKRLDKSIEKQRQDQIQVRKKLNARICELGAENAKLECLASANEKLVADLKKLKISQKRQKGDHKRFQNKLRAKCRELENSNSMLQTRVKNLKLEGLKNVNGCLELNMEINTLQNQLKIQGSKHEGAQNRINEPEALLAANVGRVQGDNNSRFSRPKKFTSQEELPRVKRGVNPWYDRSASLPVNKNSRFARPGRDLPQSTGQTSNYENKSKKVNGRGCLLLWPSSMLNDAQEFFKIARKKSKNNDMLVALLAIPVTLTMSWHECPPTNPWGENTCHENCPVLKFVKNKIPSHVLEQAIIVTNKKGLPNATVRLNLFRAVIEEFRSCGIQWDQFCSTAGVKDLCWLCVVETVSEQGLEKNHAYRHVDVNLSGWGPPNRWEKGEVAALRKTLDECGIDVKSLLQQGMMREVIHVYCTWIYAPTNKFYYQGIESQLKVQRDLCDDYLRQQGEEQARKSLRASMKRK